MTALSLACTVGVFPATPNFRRDIEHVCSVPVGLQPLDPTTDEPCELKTTVNALIVPVSPRSFLTPSAAKTLEIKPHKEFPGSLSPKLKPIVKWKGIQIDRLTNVNLCFVNHTTKSTWDWPLHDLAILSRDPAGPKIDLLLGWDFLQNTYHCRKSLDFACLPPPQFNSQLSEFEFSKDEPMTLLEFLYFEWDA